MLAAIFFDGLLPLQHVIFGMPKVFNQVAVFLGIFFLVLDIFLNVSQGIQNDILFVFDHLDATVMLLDGNMLHFNGFFQLSNFLVLNIEFFSQGHELGVGFVSFHLFVLQRVHVVLVILLQGH